MEQDEMNPSDPLLPGEANATEPPGNPKSAGHSRRVFLFKMSLLLNGAVGAILAIPIIGYLLGPALRKNSSEDSWIDLGPLTGFPEGETRLVNFRNPATTPWDGQTGDIPCWVRHISGDDFQVFAINCAHLGCPVRWFAQSRLFLCPCHGGAYYEDGSRASGPPERGLFEYRTALVGDSLLIHSGDMPTFTTEAVNKPKPLIQIAPASSADEAKAASLSTNVATPAARSNEWPA